MATINVLRFFHASYDFDTPLDCFMFVIRPALNPCNRISVCNIDFSFITH